MLRARVYAPLSVVCVYARTCLHVYACAAGTRQAREGKEGKEGRGGRRGRQGRHGRRRRGGRGGEDTS